MITKIRKGMSGINLSIAVNGTGGVRTDPTVAQATFYKVQSDGTLAVETGVGTSGVVTLVQQDSKTGFFGAGIDVSALNDGEYAVLFEATVDGTETIGVEYLSIDKALNIDLDVNNNVVLSETDKDSIVDKNWDELIADHTTAGTFGAKNQLKVPSEAIDDYKADVSSVALQADLDAVKAKTDVLTFTGNDVHSYIDAATEDEIAAKTKDAVWNAAKADYTTADTFGDYLDGKVSERLEATGYTAPDNSGIAAIKAKTDIMTFTGNDIHSVPQGEISLPVAQEDEIATKAADAVWDETRASHTTAGSFGEKNQLGVPSENIDDYKAVGFATPADVTAVENKVDIVDSVVDAVKLQTDKMQFDSNDNIKSTPQTDVEISAVSQDATVDKVWDETRSDHTLAGSFGEKNQLGVPSEDVNDYKATGYSTPTNVTDAQNAITGAIDTQTTSLSNAIAASEEEIRGSDGDTMKTLSDRIEQHDADVKGTPWDSDKTLAGLYGILEEEEHGTVVALTSDTLDINGVSLGIVMNENNDPVDDARLTAYRQSDVDYSTPVYETHTFANGDFRLLVGIGDTYNIVITKGGTSYGEKTVVVPS